MKIDDLQETAALAHLNLSEKELAAAFPAFEQMLGYFTAMQAADKDETLSPPGETPASGVTGQNAGARLVEADYFRTDDPGSLNNVSETNEKLLNNAADRDGPFVVIPNVL